MNPEELWVICNILVDDTTDDLVYGQSYADYFQVNWNGAPFRLAPGESAIVPRYLADHFATHMIDYLMTRDFRGKLRDQSVVDTLTSQIILRKADEPDRTQPSRDRGDGSSPAATSITQTGSSEPDSNHSLAEELGGDAGELSCETSEEIPGGNGTVEPFEEPADDREGQADSGSPGAEPDHVPASTNAQGGIGKPAEGNQASGTTDSTRH